MKKALFSFRATDWRGIFREISSSHSWEPVYPRPLLLEKDGDLSLFQVTEKSVWFPLAFATSFLGFVHDEYLCTEGVRVGSVCRLSWWLSASGWESITIWLMEVVSSNSSEEDPTLRSRGSRKRHQSTSNDAGICGNGLFLSHFDVGSSDYDRNREECLKGLSAHDVVDEFRNQEPARQKSLSGCEAETAETFA